MSVRMTSGPRTIERMMSKLEFTRLFRVLFWAGSAVILSSATGVRSQDFSTGFELERPELQGPHDNRPNEVFTFGDSPNSVTFRNGRVTNKSHVGIGLGQLVRTGFGSWTIGCPRAGKMTFETGATKVSFYFWQSSAGEGATESLVSMLDENFRILQNYIGQTSSWLHVEYDGPPVKTVQLTNFGVTTPGRSTCFAQGWSPFVAVDDLSFTVFEEQTLEVVDVFYFPLIGDGAAGATQLQTSLFLMSTDADVTVGVEWRDRSGNPLELALADAEPASTFEIPLDKGQSFTGQSLGTGDLQVGYGIVSVKRPVSDGQSTVNVRTQEGNAPDAGVGGTAVFTRTDNGILMTEAAVPASRTLTDFSILLDSIGARDTGLALAIPPPNPIDTQTGPANVTVTVWDTAFQTQIATTQFQLGEGEAIGMFIWELFRDFAQVSNDVLDQLRETEGVVTVAMDRPGTAVTLRQNDDGAVDFPDEVPTLVAFPVIPGRADGSVP